MDRHRLPGAVATAAICVLLVLTVNAVAENCSLTKLAGDTAVPGLQSVTVNDVSKGTTWFKGTVPALKPPGAKTDPSIAGFETGNGWVIVVSIDAMECSSLKSLPLNSPVGDLTLSKLRWYRVPAGPGTGPVPVPADVREIAGGATIAAKAGNRIEATAKLAGDTLALLRKVAPNADANALPLHGACPAALFAGSSPMGSDLINALDITLPLGEVVPATLPSFLTPDNLRLRIFGHENQLAVEGATDLKIPLGKTTALTVPTRITVFTEGGRSALRLSGSCTYTWSKPAGISWLTLKNPALDLTLGGVGPACSLTWKADLGKTKGLDVLVNWTAGVGSTSPNMGISILGRDIPLSSLELANGLPQVDQLALRDITVSSTAVAGTVKITGSNAEWGATFFTSQGKPCLVITRDNLGIRDVIPGLPDEGVFRAIMFSKAALVISAEGLSCEFAKLPTAAQDRFCYVYGEPPKKLEFAQGSIGLVGTLKPPTGAGPEAKALQAFLQAVLGAEAGTPVFSGQVAGVLGGGTPTLKLAAPVPPIQIPDSVKFLEFPKDLKAALFVDYAPATGKTDFGASITTTLKIKEKAPKRGVLLEAKTAFQMMADGGLAVEVSGTTKNQWRDAFGVEGLNLDPGTTISVIGSALKVQIDIAAKISIGNSKAELAGSAGIVGGVLAQGAIGGTVSEIPLGDLVSLTRSVTGDSRMKGDFPPAKFTNMTIGFASPGQNLTLGDVTITGGGIRLGGDFWFLFADDSLGSAHGQIDATGIALNGDIHDFQLGVVAMKGNKLDIAVGPAIPSHFLIGGKTTIAGNSVGCRFEANSQLLSIAVEQAVKGAFSYSFSSYLAVPPLLFPAPGSAVEVDLGLSGHVDVAQLNAWLAGDGATYVAGTFGGLSQDMATFKKNIDDAQNEVDKLTGDVDKRRQVVKDMRKSDSARIDDLQAQVDSLTEQIAKFEGDITSEEKKIKACDQMTSYTVHDVVSVVPWRTKARTVKCADWGARARQATQNAGHAEKIADWTTRKTLLQATKDAAKETLEQVKQGLNSLPIDMDPEIVRLTTALEGATLALSVAKQAAQGIQDASNFAQQVTNDLKASANRLRLDSAAIEGSTERALAGDPVILTLGGVLDGAKFTHRFAFSTKNAQYNADQLDLLALFVAKSALHDARSKDGQIPFGLQDLVDKAYNEKLAAVEAQLQLALESNPTNTVPELPKDSVSLAEMTQADTDAQNDTQLELRKTQRDKLIADITKAKRELREGKAFKLDIADPAKPQIKIGTTHKKKLEKRMEGAAARFVKR